MENAKRGFVFYFDNYFVVRTSPGPAGVAAVRPVRLRRAGVAGPVGDHGGDLDHYPQMSGQTRIACGFLGAAVLRDTQRWLSQRQARALRRQGGTVRAGPRLPPGSAPGAGSRTWS